MEKAAINPHKRGPKPGNARGNAGKGRIAGSHNKMTSAAKDAIEYAAQQLGGGQRLYEWAKSEPKNEAMFWGAIYPKLLPLQVNASVELADEVKKWLGTS